MWVLTENGDLVNLDQIKRIGIPWRPDLDRTPETEVKAWEAHYDAYGVTLCSCDDEAQGTAIVEQLAHEINAGKRFVYISDVKKQAGGPLGDVSRRD